MIVHTPATRLTLQPGRFTRLQLRAGTRVRGLSGSAWLTADGDPRDIVLEPCEEWVLERDGRILATALRADGQAEVQLDEDDPWQPLRLADGRVLALQPLRPADAEDQRAFFDGLSTQSRYRRFHVGLARLPSALLARLVDTHPDRHVAMVARAPGAGIVADARYVRDPDGRGADFALTVADDWQRQGIGTRLLRRLMRVAARRGVAPLHGDVLWDNRPMLELVQRLGGRLQTRSGEAGVVGVELPVPARAG